MMLRRLFAVTKPDHTRVLIGAPSPEAALEIALAPKPATGGWSVHAVVALANKEGVYAVPNGWTRASTVLLGSSTTTLGAVLDLWSTPKSGTVPATAQPKKREYDA